MAAKKKGPSMRENQQRKLTMQKIAKGGPQLSGVKKPAPAKPAAPKPPAKPNSRTLANPRSALPNSDRRGANLPRSAGAMLRERTQGPRASAKPTAKPQMVNSNSATRRQIQAKTDAARARAQGKPGIKGPINPPNSARAGKDLIRQGANRMRNLADSGQVRAAAQRGQQAVEAARRNRARLAAGVGKGAVESAAFKSGLRTGGRALLPVAIASQVENVASGFKKLANHPFIKGRPKPATPKPPAPKGPTASQRASMDSQERKARAKNEARKKSTGSAQATPNTAASFDDAFKDARRAKVGSFTWRGKKYTTEMK